MKTITTLTLLFFAQLSLASEIAHYHIEKGKLHTGGIASVEITESNTQKYTTKLNYEIYKKILVPIPDSQLKGETILDLPPEFRTEIGYMELETKGTMDIGDATLKFVRRLTWNHLVNAYEILILPKNGKSKIEIFYHPTLPAAGWGEVDITFISSIPVLNGYEVKMDID